MPLRYYIIGDDSLVIKCCEILLDHDHTILGMCSQDAACQEWAARHDIAIIKFQDFAPTLAHSEFDYLLSISNRRILSADVLRCPKYLAINYHNALLPEYGGVYATAWAILEGKTIHGITWHAMTEAIDGGDILLQASVPILPDDTMASLNTRCHAKAVETFPSLLEKIEKKDLAPIKPDRKPSYYSLQKKVRHDALISLDSSAEEIDRLFRALQSGPYLNQLGIAKIIIFNKVFIPRIIKISETLSSSSPGTLVKIDTENDLFQCATKTHDIIIGSLTDIDGTPISVNTLVEIYDLSVDNVFSPYPLDLGAKLEQFRSERYKDEAFWVAQFRKACPINLPYFERTTSVERINSGGGYLPFEYKIPSSIAKQILTVFGQYTNVEDILLAVIVMYFHKIFSYENFSVSISTPAIRSSITGLEQFCSEYIPLNLDLDAKELSSLSFSAYIEKTKKQLLSLTAHSSYERDIFLRYHGLPTSFPVALCICNRFEFDNLVKTQPKNSLTIYITGTKLTLNFNRAILPTSAFEPIAEDIFHHISTLLAAGLQDTPTLMVNLPILSAETQLALLQTWRGRPLIKDKYSRLIDMFEDVVREKSESVAIIASYHAMKTYSELDSLSSKLASYLRKQGATSGDVIAVSLETSVLSTAMLLAIMKLRATYLPLDPAYPITQLKFILANAQPRFVVSRVGLGCNFATFTGKIVYVDQNWKDISTTKRTSFGDTKTPDGENDVAYIIYTSGTTGTPKGVKVSYYNLFCAMQARFQSYEEAVPGLNPPNLLLLLSTSFDTSIAAILWPLLKGGKLVLLNPSKAKSAKSIVSKIEKCNVTHIICVPSLYRKILDYLNYESKTLQQPRLTILGGDTWDEDLTSMHKKLVRQAPLFNEYGVSEHAIACMGKQIYDPKTDVTYPITLGTPMPGVQIMILDTRQQLVPPGVIGELYLGGSQVAIGYLGFDQLNGESFVNYQLADGSTTRLYKTGDLCCLTAKDFLGKKTWEVQFKGRSDHQVKIRGFRIELQQIEHHLLSFPNINIKECVVTATEIAGEKHLVAYLVVEDATKLEIDKHELRLHLAKHLPDYMIPSFFMSLDKLPLSRNHKIDRSALPVPNLSERLIKRAYIRPRNPIEEGLISIWTQLLSIKQIGVFDNFFELGGDSLSVTELLVRVSKFFHIDVPMSSFLETPTIAYLTQIIQGVTYRDSTREKIDQMESDSILDESIRVSDLPPTSASSEHNILLTGVTGFLGIYLLRDLIVAGHNKIYCLIRAKTPEEAQAKLYNAIRVYKFSERELLTSDNVSIIIGNLEKPQFGISDADYRKLSETIDSIYHCGAWVNHMLDYDQLRATNVLGTKEILRLAAVSKVKKVFYFSTASAVTQLVPAGETLKECFAPKESDLHLVRGGYSQTKLVSERLIEQAVTRGIPVTVFRVCCWLSGDSETGIVPTAQNHLLNLIKGCIQLHCAPNWSSLRINMLPIDVASHFVVAVASQAEIAPPPVYNIRNTSEISWTSLIEWISSTYSFQITLLTPKEWYEQLKTLDTENAIYPFLLHYLNESSDKPVIQIDRAVLDDKMKTTMETLHSNYPKLEDDLLRIYFSYLLSGFISPSLQLDCQTAEQMLGLREARPEATQSI